MLRDRNPTETVLTLATFLALSLVVHMCLILSGWKWDADRPAPQEAAQAGDEPGAGEGSPR